MVKASQGVTQSSGTIKLRKDPKPSLKAAKHTEQANEETYANVSQYLKIPKAPKVPKYTKVKAEQIFMQFETPEAWETWLSKNHTKVEKYNNLWIKFAKVKALREGYIVMKFSEAVDVALCYGWMNSTRKVFEGDDNYFIQHFAPRKPDSGWTKLHVTKANELMAAGLIQPQGQIEIDEAKADGRWYAHLQDPQQNEQQQLQYAQPTFGTAFTNNVLM